MARKERNNVDYFPHSVIHGKKMFYLRDKFNNDGYAVWFMLLEELGKAEYHYLDLQDDIQLMYLSSSFKVSEILLNEIIETLVKFNEFDKELWVNEKILFNNKFIENISDAYKKRNNDCVNKSKLVLVLESKGRLIRSKLTPKPSKSNPKPLKGQLKGGGNPQRKEEYIKEYKNKEKNGEKVFSPDVINFYDSVVNMFPEVYKPKNKTSKNKWLDVIDKLNKIDGYEFDILYRIVYYARHNDFWTKNFKTIKKLRLKNKDDISYVDYFKDIIQPTVPIKSNQIGSKLVIGKTNQV